MPDVKTVTVKGKEYKTITMQYLAYLDGRIEEVALDWFAQSDDGSVWYGDVETASLAMPTEALSGSRPAQLVNRPLPPSQPAHRQRARTRQTAGQSQA